ncbi:PREDICTED: uncharacterized protein LOC109350962 [Lupinus angustifolius]|uniref:uncharacterized protein LOC109350962 n=1 Tax=Lupinus angustifolius TaxID=3871 RepID=UPI00092E5AE1|nr:PREDICTED: uncharacterized protein LOC109350962 [Lupinus angustifolius]
MEEEEEEEGDNKAENTATKLTCTILAIDHTNLCYRVCSICERTLSTTSNNNAPSFLCKFCHTNNNKRLFRILMSVATDMEVITVICFDRIAKVLFGCSADQFFDFARLHPLSGVVVNEILEGEMFTMTLSKPLNCNAQNIRVTSAVPLSSGFRPAIEVLKEFYKT